MITDNGKRFFGSKCGTVTLTCADGSTVGVGSKDDYYANVSQKTDYETSQTTYNTSFGLHLCFGSGTKEAAKDDITLDSVINGFTHVLGANTVRNDNDINNNRLLTHTKTVQYTGDEDITINEVCLYYSSQVGTGETSALLAREVLDEPIVMSKGDMRSFTFNIEGI